ncbi:MAG: hypothetical protein HC917_10525 [Richelia sp. SM2_1_7]|nr:hypothetical protein [Richelia sp. SM2_1_7]
MEELNQELKDWKNQSMTSQEIKNKIFDELCKRRVVYGGMTIHTSNSLEESKDLKRIGKSVA